MLCLDPGVGSEVVVEESVLATLVDQVGDQAAREVVEVYLATLPGRVSQVRGCTDAAELRSAAHTWKSPVTRC